MDGSEIQRTSRALLNGDHRLRVAAAIATLPSTGFRTAELVAACELSEVTVSREIKHFRDLLLLDRVSHGRYARRVDPFWKGCGILFADLGGVLPEREGRRRRA